MAIIIYEYILGLKLIVGDEQLMLLMIQFAILQIIRPYSNFQNKILVFHLITSVINEAMVIIPFSIAITVIFVLYFFQNL